MQWYEGGIAEAVTLSRKKSAIFVVYIEGSDEKSKQFTKIINDRGVAEVLESDNFVAIKVEANSLPHQQFSEIYKQTPTPSIYFIGKTGAPIEIITEAPDTPTIVDKVNNILVKNGGSAIKIKTENLLQSEASASNCVAPTSPAACVKTEEPASSTEAATDGGDSPEPPPSNVVCDGDVCRKVPEAPEEPKAQTTNDVKAENVKGEHVLSAEEKLKLAQELIEKKRLMKKAEEEEKEKNKEIERRKMGHDVQNMKRWQQEQEIKQRMEEREKEKREEKEAREKVRRQIEEDKREKAARLASASTSVQPPSPEPPRTVKPSNSNSARLQFRLPDGSSHTHDFQSSLPLREVISYIKTNININFSNFVLSTTFPRREFSTNDASQTLLDLQLVPNAVILVLPVSHGTVATNNDSGFMGIVWYFLTPILYIFGYLKGLFFKKPEDNETNKRPAVPIEPEGEPNPVPKRRAGEAAIKRHGNVHRLTDKDSDDENNTWNGNSTQQM